MAIPSLDGQPVHRADGGQNWLGRHWQKGVALAAWVVLLGGYTWYAKAHHLGPVPAVRALIRLMQHSMAGPLIYIGVYALRPLLFFSSVLLTLAGGFLFGPVWGIFYTVIAGNTSAMVAYAVGRYFGTGLLGAEQSGGVIQGYATRMRRNSFETVLIMRFIFLPYDLVSYLAGLLHIDWKAFLLATALGSIPGTIAVVLFGASLEGNFTGGLPKINPWVLATSVTLFVASLGLSRYFRRRERSRVSLRNPASE